MERLRRSNLAGGAGRLMPGVVLSAWVLSGLLLAGCNEPPAVNPWRDDSIPSSAYGTSSSDIVLAAQKEPVVRVREVPPTPGPVVNAQVPHYPLWWEDPFEDQGNGNDEFAWTWQDYFTMPYGFARFALNTVAVPVSAVVTPPWVSMVSDGCVEGVHDAQRGISPDPVAGPEDFVQGPGEVAEPPLQPVPPAELPAEPG